MLVLGNEGEGPRRMQGRHTHGIYIRIGFNEASGFALNVIHHSIEARNMFSFCMPMFSPNANMNSFLYEPHSHMYTQ